MRKVIISFDEHTAFDRVKHEECVCVDSVSIHTQGLHKACVPVSPGVSLQTETQVYEYLYLSFNLFF